MLIPIPPISLLNYQAGVLATIGRPEEATTQPALKRPSVLQPIQSPSPKFEITGRHIPEQPWNDHANYFAASSESVTNPICYVCTHIFKIISNKWVQQSHNGTMHFRLMAFGCIPFMYDNLSQHCCKIEFLVKLVNQYIIVPYFSSLKAPLSNSIIFIKT